MSKEGVPPQSEAGLRSFFGEQQAFLNHFFDSIDYGPVSEFCRIILDTKGVTFFTGVGKSGFIAQKISMTLVSTGTKSVYLNPTDALHGDIGIVGKEDVIVMFSKSGATEELLKLTPYARAKGAKILGVSSVPGSKLAQVSDLHVTLPLERELCPFDLAPVTSTAIQMLFGDTCAVAIMQAKNLTKDQYAMNHPAGRIGKRLILRVCDVMKPSDALPLCKPGDLLVNTLVELSSKGCGCVLMVDEQMALLGTFTDGDLRRALNSKGGAVLNMSMGELANTSPRTVGTEDKAVDAMHAMENPTPVTFLPCVEGGRTLKGLVTLHGLVNAGL